MFENFNKTYSPILKKEIIGPIFIVIFALVIYAFVTKVTKKIFKLKNKKIDDRRLKTIVSLINNIFKYLILIIALLMILDIYGISTSGFITSLGIVGVAAGLAVQDILKDILSGASIILENQYAVGDIVEINGFKGEIVDLGLRTTKIQAACTGEIKIVSNRNIVEVINYSISKNSLYFDIPVSYDDDIDKVIKALNDVCEKVKKENSIIDNSYCIGINSFDSSSIAYRVVIESDVKNSLMAKRILLKEIKQTFDKKKITIPYDQVVIHNA